MTIKNIKMFLLGLYFILLPIDTALGNIIGSMSIVNYIIILYICLFILELLFRQNKQNIILKKSTATVIVLLIWYLVTLIFSVRNILESLGESTMYSLVLASVFYLVLCSDVFEKKEKDYISTCIFISAIAILLATLYSYSAGFNIAGRFTLFLGRYFDPNYFAVGLNLLFILSLHRLCNKCNVLISITCIIGALVILLMTGSRGGLLTLGGSAGVYILQKYKCKMHKLVFLLAIATFVGVIVFGIVDNLVPQYVLDRMNIIGTLDDGGSGRTVYWKSALHYAESEGNVFRYLFGFGPFSFSVATAKYLGFEAAPHNIFVQATFETGIVGLSLLLYLLFLNFKIALKNKNILMFSLMIGALLSGLTLDVINTRFFWIVLFLNNINYNGEVHAKKGVTYFENNNLR